MSKNQTRQRYYYPLRKQLKTYATLVVICVATVLFGLSLEDRSVGDLLVILSVVYPVIIIMDLLTNIRPLNYTDVDTEGMHRTNMGLFHKDVCWSEIESLSTVLINGTENIGINFLRPYKRRGLKAAMLRRNFGSEELFRQGYSADGQSLLRAAHQRMSKTGQRNVPKPMGTSSGAGKVSPATFEHSFKLSDLWTKPNSLGWFGASLVFGVIGGSLKQKNHMLSTAFGLLGLVALGLSSSSLARLRRVETVQRKQSKLKKQDNDWSNLM